MVGDNVPGLVSVLFSLMYKQFRLILFLLPKHVANKHQNLHGMGTTII